MQFDFQAMKPMDRYELLLGTVLPRPITIVTTLSVDGALNAAPYNLVRRLEYDDSDEQQHCGAAINHSNSTRPLCVGGAVFQSRIMMERHVNHRSPP